jgi:predicted CoA-binding protein
VTNRYLGILSGEIDVAVIFRAGEHLEDTARDVAAHMKTKGTKAFWMQASSLTLTAGRVCAYYFPQF